ncbi:MAG: hypothetical protein ACOY3I_03195 [Verrucomicrobiota bacterium]
MYSINYMPPDPFAIAQEVSEKTGYQYEKISDHVWKFLFTGRHMLEIDVLAVWQGQLFIFGAIVVSQQMLNGDKKLSNELLLLNNNLDRVKIGFNQENMLFVRSDISVRTLDFQEFKDNMDQVAAATDYIYGLIKPYLVSER